MEFSGTRRQCTDFAGALWARNWGPAPICSTASRHSLGEDRGAAL